MGHAEAEVADDCGSDCFIRTALEAASAIVLDIPGELAGGLQTLLVEAPAPQATK